jgi:alkanesulfonate monooxygenase SsuD/methylene tetrahydromethanopterin reductase-like flavin-dependent oxidoreductase (luciferase family)
MKIELVTPFRYFGTTPADAPTSPGDFDAQTGLDSFELGMQQGEAGHAAGFDSLNITEHHYSTGLMSAAPHQVVAALGQRIPSAQFGLYGTDLLLHNPVSIAEQYATLDNLVSGRLRFGLLRGTPNEYATYGTNPWESRERFEEAVELVIRIFAEPEPFGWEGRFYRFRNIAVIPKPFQRPHPRILLSGNSASSAHFAGRMRCDLGISFADPSAAALSVAAYREGAAEVGWEPEPDNILYRHFIVLAESDKEAVTLTQNGGPGFGGPSGRMNVQMGMLMATVGAAMAGVPRGTPPSPSKLPAMGEPFVGGPDTVLTRIAEVRNQIGMGRIEFAVMGAPRHEDVLRAIALMGETIVPTLHAEDLVSSTVTTQTDTGRNA